MLNGDRDVGQPIGCSMLDKMKWDVRNSFLVDPLLTNLYASLLP
jgi:hypothetical protein